MMFCLYTFLWLLPGFLHGTYALSVKESCGKALGLEDGRIKDYQLTASSSYQPSLVGPNIGRLNTEAGGGAWCPKSQIENTNESAEYLEIDLLSDHIISSVLIQGRYGNGLGQEFAEFFAFEYRSSIDQQYIRYTDEKGISVLPANINTFQVTQYNLTKIIVADAVRIFPLSEYPRTVCLRVELTGCPYSGEKDFALWGVTIHW
jgi:discoidin domain receptor family protein 2